MAEAQRTREQILLTRKSALSKAALKEEDRYTRMLKTIPKISDLEVNNTIAMHPVFACSMMDMMLTMANGRKPNFIPYLIGNPGTGKTYAAEKLVETSLEKTNRIFSSITSKEGKRKDLENALESCISQGLLSENYDPKVNDQFLNYFESSAFLTQIMSNFLETYSKSNDKENIRTQFNNLMYSLDHIAALGISPEDMQARLNKGVETRVYVLPSAYSATDIISEEVYVISPSGVEQKIRNPIMDILTDAYSGKIPILIIDEASETLKEKEASRVKNLHPLFDAQINGKPLVIGISKESLDSETKASLERFKDAVSKRFEEKDFWTENHRDELDSLLNDIDRIEKGKLVQLNIPLPETFCIMATGNVRKEYEQLGLTESTWRRFQPIKFSYLPPDHMRNFLNDLVSKYEDELKKELGSDFASIDKDMKEPRSKFVQELGVLYENLYKDYLKNPQNFVNRMLPSLRSMAFAIRSFESYYAMSRKIKDSDRFDGIGCSAISFSFTSVGGNKISNVSKQEKKFKDLLPTQRQYSDFLLASLEFSTHIPIGSFTETSESRTSETQFSIEEKGREIFSVRSVLDSDMGKLFSLKVGGKEYLYSYPNYMNMLYTLSNSLSRQRLILLVGESQEGKSTMAKLTQSMLKEYSGVFGLDDAHNFSIDNTEEFTLKDPNVERMEGDTRKSIKKSMLRSVVEDASETQNSNFVIQVDEIDNLKFSQELNTLFTRNRIAIKGVNYDIGNVVIIGTSNMSRMMLDNFVSRSGIPLLFTESLSTARYSGNEIDMRNVYMIYSSLEQSFGNSEKANAALTIALNNSRISDNLSEIQFYELSRTAPNLMKYLSGKKDPVKAINDYAEYISKAINESREKAKKGDVFD